MKKNISDFFDAATDKVDKIALGEPKGVPVGQYSEEIFSALKIPPPHQLWQRGTNKNTNGLLREYFPKGYNFTHLSEENLQKVVDQLNHRPRKCLGYRTPAEVYFSTPLHLT